MHIAICDDNIADRKQTERLMGRECDKWIALGNPMYVDSYGNAESLMKTPMLYDGFMIDVCHTCGISGLQIVDKLREKGVSAPIVMVCSDVDYRTQDFDKDILFLDKPLSPERLHEMMLKINDIASHTVSQIELRGETETLYVSEEEILYAIQSGFTYSVTLTQGRSLTSRGSIDILFDEIKDTHPTFVMPNSRTILNIRHIDKITFSSAIMEDGTKCKIHGYQKKYAKTVLQILATGNEESLKDL